MVTAFTWSRESCARPEFCLYSFLCILPLYLQLSMNFSTSAQPYTGDESSASECLSFHSSYIRRLCYLRRLHEARRLHALFQICLRALQTEHNIQNMTAYKAETRVVWQVLDATPIMNRQGVRETTRSPKTSLCSNLLPRRAPAPPGQPRPCQPRIRATPVTEGLVARTGRPLRLNLTRSRLSLLIG